MPISPSTPSLVPSATVQLNRRDFIQSLLGLSTAATLATSCGEANRNRAQELLRAALIDGPYIRDLEKEANNALHKHGVDVENVAFAYANKNAGLVIGYKDQLKDPRGNNLSVIFVPIKRASGNCFFGESQQISNTKVFTLEDGTPSRFLIAFDCKKHIDRTLSPMDLASSKSPSLYLIGPQGFCTAKDAVTDFTESELQRMYLGLVRACQNNVNQSPSNQEFIDDLKNAQRQLALCKATEFQAGSTSRVASHSGEINFKGSYEAKHLEFPHGLTADQIPDAVLAKVN